MSRHGSDNRRKRRRHRHRHRRPSPAMEYALGSQISDSARAYQEDPCRGTHARPNLTTKWSKKKRILGLCTVWLGLIAAVGFLSFNLIYAVLLVVARPAPTDLNSPDFTWYKNSQFEACVNSSPEQVNCTLLEADLQPSPYADLRWVGKERDQYFITRPEYEVSAPAPVPWCDLASCMAGWKIVPSIVRDSAFGFTAPKAWSFLLISAIAPLWDFRGILSPLETCKRGGFIDWTLLVWKAGQLGFWWWAYVTFIRDPAVAAPVSLTGWISTWSLADNFNLHLWACYFSPDSSLRRTIATTLKIATFVQWSATLNALQQHNNRDSIQKYDCLYSSIASAPGSSPCAAEQLCLKRWLFSNPDFASSDTETVIVFYMIAVYIAIVAYPICLLVYTIPKAIRPWFPRRIEQAIQLGLVFGKESELQLFRSAMFLLFAYLGLVYSIPFFTSPDFKVGFHGNSSWSTLAYDLNCRAVHVGISPTYAYLDINAFARNVRIAKMLFNAG